MGLASDTLDRMIESMIFYPDSFMLQGPADFGLDYEEMRFQTEDGVSLHGWLIPVAAPEAVILYCHGNAGNISHRLDRLFRLHQIGLSVFIFDYRGYGRSGGMPTEKGFYLDAEAAYGVARVVADRERARLIIFGRSLGGIAAVHIASSLPCSGVILESTFTHLGALASEHFPVPMVDGFLEDRFNAVNKIAGVPAPKLIIHGDQDEIAPYRYGRALYDQALEPKEFYTLEGAAHNDTYIVGGGAYFEKLRQFILRLPEHA